MSESGSWKARYGRRNQSERIIWQDNITHFKRDSIDGRKGGTGQHFFFSGQVVSENEKIDGLIDWANGDALQVVCK